jgi:hypothetical protein
MSDGHCAKYMPGWVQVTGLMVDVINLWILTVIATPTGLSEWLWVFQLCGLIWLSALTINTFVFAKTHTPCHAFVWRAFAEMVHFVTAILAFISSANKTDQIIYIILGFYNILFTIPVVLIGYPPLFKHQSVVPHLEPIQVIKITEASS